MKTNLLLALALSACAVEASPLPEEPTFAKLDAGSGSGVACAQAGVSCPPATSPPLVKPLLINAVNGQPFEVPATAWSANSGGLVRMTQAGTWLVPISGLHVGDRIMAIRAEVQGGGTVPVTMEIFEEIFGVSTSILGSPAVVSTGTAGLPSDIHSLEQNALSYVMQPNDSVVLELSNTGATTSLAAQYGTVQVQFTPAP